MAKTECYRIIEGKLVSKSIEIPLVFGLISEDDGIFFTEFYTPESFDLNNFVALVDSDDTHGFNAFCITEDSNELEIRSLSIRSIVFNARKILLECYDCIIHKTRDFPKTPFGKQYQKSALHYLEFEGLQIEFCEYTSYKEIRGNDCVAMERDHSKALLVANSIPYNLEFNKTNSKNIIVSFPNESNSTLTYNAFLDLRNDFTSLLSFLNGARVKIRKEYTGETFSKLGRRPISSQVTITYSFKRLHPERLDSYIPLNHTSNNRVTNILNRIFSLSFDKYREWNKRIDLNSIVYALNAAAEATHVEEKFFIQIIAFERLTAQYAVAMGFAIEYLPDPLDYAEIKRQLFDVIERNKGLFGRNYHNAKAIIGGLNQVKPQTTQEKMLRLIADVRLQLSDDLVNLVNVVRHKVIHWGDVGDGLDGVKNLYLLNELLHEIILRLIDYTGIRNSAVLLANP
jgi:hypothetical protein